MGHKRELPINQNLKIQGCISEDRFEQSVILFLYTILYAYILFHIIGWIKERGTLKKLFCFKSQSFYLCDILRLVEKNTFWIWWCLKYIIWVCNTGNSGWLAEHATFKQWKHGCTYYFAWQIHVYLFGIFPNILIFGIR